MQELLERSFVSIIIFVQLNEIRGFPLLFLIVFTGDREKQKKSSSGKDARAVETTALFASTRLGRLVPGVQALSERRFGRN